MARRKSNFEALAGVVVVLAFVVWLARKMSDSVGFGTPIAILVFLVAGFAWLKYNQKQKRIAYLRDKYGDEAIVQRILERIPWQGQTAEQLRDSVGSPVSIDNKVMATRKREVWKYKPSGRNRYALRITLDDDVVIGWDQKN